MALTSRLTPPALRLNSMKDRFSHWMRGLKAFMELGIGPRIGSDLRYVAPLQGGIDSSAWGLRSSYASASFPWAMLVWADAK